jgi:[glutamine synthetase] adenylyltransferase / [glutamine synthetase]-adenylyl-L-tyrosine phosphorylase
VNSLGGALVYYESFGQTWERAAMLKARSIAGDLGLGAGFLTEMRPFVYRRYLDFATIEEIQEMKARVHREHSRARLDRDVKLGPGGIRDVEFVAQALQLIHGGRDERLQVRPTLGALRAIADVGVIDVDEARGLAVAYRFLRDLEHKLQIVHERQTQVIPADREEERRLARRLGFHRRTSAGSPNGAADADEVTRFRAELERHRRRVLASFEKLFHDAREEIRRTPDEEILGLFHDLDDEASTEETLGRLGFRDPGVARENLRLLRDGPKFSPSSPRRRKALLELAPTLFAEIRRASDADLALHHMAEFISAIGARTSFLALLTENPETLRLLVGLFGSSRYLSNFFLRHPELLDSLVRADLAVVRKTRAALDAELRSLLDAAVDYESELDSLRRFRNEEFLRIGVNDIHGLLDAEEVNQQLSDLAEACVAAALRIAERSLAGRYGTPPGRFTIVGMGKLGGRELNYNSDLDLIYVYDAPVDAMAGALSVHEYFTKLAQRLMVVLQLTTREGHVYKIDTRLRPSGSSGPLVSSLEAFRRYHEGSAALWERQALIRARAIVGEPELGADVERIIRTFVFGKPLAPADVAEIARLRARMEQELARESEERWNIKTGRGGLVDIEFLVQMLQLRHGHERTSIRVRSTAAALRAMLDEGLLPAEDHRVLAEGHRFLRRLESRLRIERDQPVEALEHDAAAAVARRMGYEGTLPEAASALLDDFERVRESVREVYARIFGAAASPEPPAAPSPRSTADSH